MNKEILNFVANEPVSAIALTLPDGSPYVATLHHAHTEVPFCLIYETSNDSRKFTAFSKGNSVRASVVIGVNEKDMRTLQLNGVATRIPKDDPRVQVYIAKFPKKATRIAGERIEFFIFIPAWWRYSSFSPEKGRVMVACHDGMETPEFGIPRDNEEQRDGGCGIIFDPSTKRYAVGKQDSDGCYRLFSGGVAKGEDMEQGVLREVLEESGLYDYLHVEKVAQAKTHYFNSLRNVNRVAFATCYLVVLKSAELKAIHHEDHEKFSLVWVTAEELVTNWQKNNANNDYDHWIYFLDKAVARARELGYL